MATFESQNGPDEPSVVVVVVMATTAESSRQVYYGLPTGAHDTGAVSLFTKRAGHFYSLLLVAHTVTFADSRHKNILYIYFPFSSSSSLSFLLPKRRPFWPITIETIRDRAADDKTLCKFAH